MKNILARGGIEFLAVLLGITISLWVEDWRENRDIQLRIVEDYVNIQEEIKSDIIHIENIIGLVNKQIFHLEKLIKYSKNEIIFDYNDIIANLKEITSPTFFGTQTGYNASVSSGRLNSSQNMSISNEISLLYEHYYKRLNANSVIWDDRMLIFKAEHIIEFYSAIYDSTDINSPEIKTAYYNKNLINALYWILEYPKKLYINRLLETQNQMIITMNKIDEYLISK
mgnify:CR=1 FL=1|tara:strand:+ start:940 stop:1617 length:678 start_codon:yes stop_codon:yes gene_type:complete